MAGYTIQIHETGGVSFTINEQTFFIQRFEPLEQGDMEHYEFIAKMLDKALSKLQESK